MLVTDLELPEFDYFDPDMRGDRYHEQVAALRERSWVAKAELVDLLRAHIGSAVVTSRRLTLSVRRPAVAA